MAALEEKKLGIEPGKPFDIGKIDPAIARGLEGGQGSADQDAGRRRQECTTENGWINMLNHGPLRHRLQHPGRRRVHGARRQSAAEDTVYPTAYMDGDGKPLDSANTYVMRFEKGQLPPTNGTWSVSQYTPGHFYVVNVLNRYAIAPWMPLKFNADGSLDIYLQAHSPGPEKESNWLPTPPGRVQPHAAQLLSEGKRVDGSYKVPPVKKVP